MKTKSLSAGAASPFDKREKITVKIALFFGGKVSRHLVLVKKAAKKMGVELDLVSYNEVGFDTVSGVVRLKKNKVTDYDVLFFRTTGKHWEEVSLILDAAKENITSGKTVVVDPLVLNGRPSDACKAYQMLALTRAGIDVPKTVYGSLWSLYEYMNHNEQLRNNFSNSRSAGVQRIIKIISSVVGNDKKQNSDKYIKLDFPVILKGSGGDRGTRVFKADNLAELEKLVRDLRKTETAEGKRYMLQEYIPNDGDYRVLVLGEKVLGVMKRSSQSEAEFRNNYSAGGKVEVADLPEEIKELAKKAAKTCGLWVAGVDVAFRDFDMKKPVIWEVNKGPQFKGFMEATGIDVPKEIIKFLVSLKKC